MTCPPYKINLDSPSHLYPNPPFLNVPANQIQLWTPCGQNHPGRDYLFTGATFDVTPVYAMDSGTIAWSVPGYLGIKGDNDGKVITEYVHVQPRADLLNAVGRHVNAREQIATLSKLGQFTGTPIAHVHINRIVENLQLDACGHIYSCNWKIQGVSDTVNQGTGTCPNANGWGLNSNREWTYCQNGQPQRGWFTGSGGALYFTDSNGVWAGFMQFPNGNIKYRYRQDRNSNTTRVATNTRICSLGQYWYFDNNGNMVRNTTIGQLNFGPNGACTNCGNCNTQS